MAQIDPLTVKIEVTMDDGSPITLRNPGIIPFDAKTMVIGESGVVHYKPLDPPRWILEARIPARSRSEQAVLTPIVRQPPEYGPSPFERLLAGPHNWSESDPTRERKPFRPRLTLNMIFEPLEHHSHVLSLDLTPDSEQPAPSLIWIAARFGGTPARAREMLTRAITALETLRSQI